MKRLTFCLVTTAWLASMVPTAPAVGLLATADIHPDRNLGGCATVSFSRSQATIVGELTVTGSNIITAGAISADSESTLALPQVFGDVTPVIATVRSNWTGCVTGAQDPIRYGHATFTFTASGTEGGEVVEVLQCTVSNWVMRCS